MARQAEPVAPRRKTALPLRIGFVGAGRAATSLAGSLGRRGHELAIARRGASAAHLSRTLGLVPRELERVAADVDVLVLAVPDRAVERVAAELARGPAVHSAVALHLAGSLGREALARLRARGFAVAALHPLQVLSGGPLPPGTTFAVDADPAARVVVSRLVDDLGGVELEVPGPARPAYHAAAVIAANLGMALVGEAADLLQAHGIERRQALEGLTGLVRGGLDTAAERGLPEALTGPVVRGDTPTVAGHLEVLSSDPQLLAAYRAVSLLLLRQSTRTGRPTAQEAEAMRQLLEENR